MLTTEQLNAIKERTEKASNVNNSGWYVDEDYSDTIRDAWDCELIAQVARGKENDAEFIAHAREDIPTLIAEVERLRKENEELHFAGLKEATEEAFGGTIALNAEIYAEIIRTRTGVNHDD